MSNIIATAKNRAGAKVLITEETEALRRWTCEGCRATGTWLDGISGTRATRAQEHADACSFS